MNKSWVGWVPNARLPTDSHYSSLCGEWKSVACRSPTWALSKVPYRNADFGGRQQTQARIQSWGYCKLPDDSKSLKADILYDNWHIILKNARAVNYKERLSSCYKLKENKEVWQLNAIHELGSGSFALKDIIGTYGKFHLQYDTK